MPYHRHWPASLSTALLNADLNSKRPIVDLNRTVDLKCSRKLFGDFICGGCKKRWNSSSVQVEISYTFNHIKMRGEIAIEEYRQRCNRCRKGNDWVRPDFKQHETDRASEYLANKILEKFYGKERDASMPQRDHAPREKPHDKRNCEGCLMGVCEQMAGMSVGYRAPSHRHQQRVSPHRSSIAWVLLDGSNEVELIGEDHSEYSSDDE